jgi:hypothetical protein
MGLRPSRMLDPNGRFGIGIRVPFAAHNIHRLPVFIDLIELKARTGNFYSVPLLHGRKVKLPLGLGGRQMIRTKVCLG